MNIKCAYGKLEKIDNLILNPKNTNKHPEKQIKLLAKLIDKHGFRSPIIVSNRSGFVVAGHCRIAASKLLGYETIPVDYQDFESEALEYSFLESDNLIADLAEHDHTMMLENIKDLELDEAFDLELFGIPDLNILAIDEELEEKDEPLDLSEKKYLIEVQFPNDMELADVRDELTHRGYLVKVL